ncbi:MAG: cytochrome c [Acidobacteria bacterium]|nr:cytochrome c [Acidobacteriota bacterium]
MKHLKSLVVFAAILAGACGQTSSGGIAVKDVAVTRALFASQQCAVCHGPEGKGGVGANLTTGMPMQRSLEQIEAQIKNGSGVMPAFKDKLSEEQIQELAKFVYKEIQKR